MSGRAPLLSGAALADPPAKVDAALERLHMRRLLMWAIKEIQETTDELERSHLDPKTGDVDDPDVEMDISRARRWILEAREVLGERPA